MSYTKPIVILGSDELAVSLATLSIANSMLPIVLAERSRAPHLKAKLKPLIESEYLLLSYTDFSFPRTLDLLDYELKRRNLRLEMIAILEQIDIPSRLKSILEEKEDLLEEELTEAFRWALSLFKKIRQLVSLLGEGGRGLILISEAADYPMEYQSTISLASSVLKSLVSSLRTERLLEERKVKIMMMHPGLGDTAIARAGIPITQSYLSKISSYILEKLLNPPKEIGSKRIERFGEIKVF